MACQGLYHGTVSQRLGPSCHKKALFHMRFWEWLQSPRQGHIPLSTMYKAIVHHKVKVLKVSNHLDLRGTQTLATTSTGPQCPT